MVTYKGKELYAIYLSDGEYDSYRHCTIAITDSVREAKDIVAELNLIHAKNIVTELNLIHEDETFTILNLDEDSEVYKDIKTEYGLFHDSIFGWETIPVISFKED